jgi:hypothetical protein
MRRGISLITAIFIMLAIASIGVALLSLSSATTQQSSDAFLKAQAELLARSATEVAILRIAERDYSGSGDQPEDFDFHIRADPFDINATIRFMDTSGHPEHNGTAIIDVAVSTDTGLNPIRFHRQSVQQP